MKLKKGSKEAKAFMAKIRAKRSTTKKVTARKKVIVRKKVKPKKVGSILKLTPKETRLGATDKDTKTRAKSYHSDKKSHNVNIRVVSGINGVLIGEVKSKYDELTKWNKILDNLKIEASKKTTNKGLLAAVKMDITRVKNHIKDIKKDITKQNRKIK